MAIGSKLKFQIFRASDAPGLMESACMSIEPMTDVQRTGLNKLLAEGYLEGDEVTVLCNIPGFSLTHAWLKKDYPLPLHSHDSDCLYCVVAGSLTMGTETLGPRDTFFVPDGVPYTYKPGPEGVEVLEFRKAAHFNFLNLAKGEAWWTKATETISANCADWKTAHPPSSFIPPSHNS
jgi:mannose-6-phosphate isomerase-like protein (cupin superfamily)